MKIEKPKWWKFVIDWVGHEDGTTSFMIREPQAGWDEDMGNYDLIIRDWETLK